MAKYTKIAYFMAAFAVVANLMVVESGDALSCSDVGASVAQCGAYATGSVPQASGGCCNAVRGLYGMARTTADRRVLCNCLKQSASSLPGVQLPNIESIPRKCGVPVSFSVNPSLNCNSIN